MCLYKLFMHVYVSVCARSQPRMFSPEEPFTLVSETPESWALLSRLDWLVSKPQGLAPLHLAALGIISP